MPSFLRTRGLQILAGAIFLGVLAVVGYSMLFSTFQLYDDEGYVLISLKSFAEHGSLYDKVYSQYGPLFYLGYDLLHRLIGFAWTNTAGRWITLVNWLGTAAVCAWIVVRARGPLVAALFVLASVFSFLWIMINEPMHPGGTIALLVALAAGLGTEALRARRPVLFALIAATASAAAVLIKINVGLFLTLSGGLALLAATPSRGARYVFAGAATVATLFPALLMGELLYEPWVREYALLTGLSIASVVAVLAEKPDSGAEAASSWSAIGIGVATGLGVIAITSGWLMARGTSPAGLLEGVLLGPLRHPLVYSSPVRWQPGAVGVALGALALVVLARRRRSDPRWASVIASVRLVVAAAFPLTLLTSFAEMEADIWLSYGVPLAGLFALPLTTDASHPGAARARSWIALLLVFQSLHAYPVAGSQLFWGAFLWVPLMMLGAWEGLNVVLARSTPGVASACRTAAGTLAAGLAVVLAAQLVRNADLRRRASEPLALPGAERIAMATPTATALQILTTNVVAHGDVLFSLPGAFSFNLWSGVPTPTLANVTHWFSLLTPEEQQAIVDRLTASPHAVFIVQHNILATVMEKGIHPHGPLMQFLSAAFQRAFAIEGYSFWVRKGRSIAPLSTGVLFPGGDAPQGPQRLEVTIASGPVDVSRVELWAVVRGRWLAQRLDATNGRATLTPLRLDGTAAGPSTALSWPLHLRGVYQLTVGFAADRPLPPDADLLAILLDPAGHRVGMARVLPHRALPPATLTP